MITAMSPSTTGSRDVMASTLSRLTCAVPANRTSRPPGPADGMQRVELSFGGVGEQRRGAAHCQVRAAVGHADGRHPRYIGNLRQIHCVPVELHLGQPVGIGHRDGDGGCGVVGEFGAQLIADLVRRRGFRQYPIVGKPPLHPEERSTEHDEQGDDRQSRGQGMPHHRFRPAVEGLLLDGASGRFRPVQNPTDQSANVHGLQPIADQNECRGRDEQCGECREADGGDTRVGERLEERHGEDGHHGHRQGHDRGREHDGTPCCRHGGNHCGVAPGAVRKLVAVSADDQQRVVDGERQTHCCAEVQREDRHVRESGDTTKYGK